MKAQFFWGLILLFGLILGITISGLHLIFYITDWVFDFSLAGATLWVLRLILSGLILAFAAVQVRKRVSESSFLLIAVHIILICGVATLPDSLYQNYFYRHDPEFDIKIMTLAKSRHQALSQEKEYAADAKVQATIQSQILLIEKAIEEVKAQLPYSFQHLFRGSLKSLLFTGLIYGAILGLIFGYLLKG